MKTPIKELSKELGISYTVIETLIDVLGMSFSEIRSLFNEGKPFDGA